jgi:uncharacterized protein DUF4159
MRRAAAASLVALLLAAGLGAQEFFSQFQRGFRRAAPRFATPASFDGSFTFCRLFYESVRWEDGGQGWWTDYPDADTNFSIRLSELTKTRVSFEPAGTPNHLVVRADAEELSHCPFVTVEDAGTAEFTESEVRGLRAYLMKGGFLWADDFWGPDALENWSAELARILPPREYPIKDIPPNHPVFRMMFEFDRVPQIPSIQRWRMSGGQTSERGPLSAQVNFKGISDPRGRLMVLLTHNTDIADAWEREGEDPRFFYLFSPDGYAVGINIYLYATTH